MVQRIGQGEWIGKFARVRMETGNRIKRKIEMNSADGEHGWCVISRITVSLGKKLFFKVFFPVRCTTQ